MKRFHSPLTRVLRLRQQTERMSRLQVARARSELNQAVDQLAAAQLAAERTASVLESQLLHPSSSLMIGQAQLELADAVFVVQQRLSERSDAEERLRASIEAFRIAQRDREIVEKAVARHRDEHRRSNARAGAIELQEWALRPAASSIDTDQEDQTNA